MAERNASSEGVLSAKRYILNDECEAVERAIQKQIGIGNSMLSTFQSNFRRQFSEALVLELETDFDSWNNYNITLLKTAFTDPDIVADYENAGGLWISYPVAADRASWIIRYCAHKIAILESLREQMPLFDKASRVAASKQGGIVRLGDKVFIVHGRDDGLKQTVARFIERLGLDVVILHEQPNQGNTIIEKLETHSSDVDIGYAVVLLTPDDVGKLASDEGTTSPRARQNVIVELGYFMGKLGRARVCPLLVEGVETPSDYHGVAYIPLDKTEGWKLKLANELKAAGFDIDLNKVK